MDLLMYDQTADLVIVGGGLPGIVAAVAAARLGLTVSLINNRGFIGGNTSAEIGVGINGADHMNEFNFNARETGIMGEIYIKNLYKNSQGNRYHWDTILMDMIEKEKNIVLFMNTNVDKVTKNEDGDIVCVSGVQNTSEKRFNFHSKYFVDNTGDGTLGYLSGADFRMGREARSEFGESIAPEAADDYTLLSTMIFYSHDVGKPVKYIPPSFALDIEKSGILKHRKIPDSKRVMWYYEIGGGLNQISDSEEIIKQHRALVYGIWDYIKNKNNYYAENFDLDFVSCIPGKRESRRLMGDYILTQNDITGRVDFDDGVAYGGWSIDLHSLMGVYGTDPVNYHYMLDGIYQIPYRCYYSRNVNNLFMIGRCMSSSHIAFGTTRLTATLALGGQVVGTAAFLCRKYNTSPRGIYQDYIKELKQMLLDQDCYVVGEKWENISDLAFKASIKASSAAVLKLDVPDQMIPLQNNHGFTLPVAESIESIYVYAEALEDTELEYEIHVSDKKENYHPVKSLKRGSVHLTQGSSWVKLDADCIVDRMFVFIELKNNPSVKIAYVKDHLPGITCVSKDPNIHGNRLVTLDSEMKEYVWRKMQGSDGYGPTICFKIYPAQNVYEPDNIINGYTRAYGQPNLWLAEGAAGEWLEAEMAEEHCIKKIRLTFDALLDFRITNNEHYNFNTLLTIIRNYDIYVRTKGKYQIVKRVTDNFERVNTINLEGVRGDAVKIVINNTNGSKRAGIQALNIF